MEKNGRESDGIHVLSQAASGISDPPKRDDEPLEVCIEDKEIRSAPEITKARRVLHAHSAASQEHLLISFRDNGAAFVGPSGSGKSTTLNQLLRTTALTFCKNSSSEVDLSWSNLNIVDDACSHGRFSESDLVVCRSSVSESKLNSNDKEQPFFVPAAQGNTDDATTEVMISIGGSAVPSAAVAFESVEDVVKDIGVARSVLSQRASKDLQRLIQGVRCNEATVDQIEQELGWRNDMPSIVRAVRSVADVSLLFDAKSNYDADLIHSEIRPLLGKCFLVAGCGENIHADRVAVRNTVSQLLAALQEMSPVAGHTSGLGCYSESEASFDVNLHETLHSLLLGKKARTGFTRYFVRRAWMRFPSSAVADGRWLVDMPGFNDPDTRKLRDATTLLQDVNMLVVVLPTWKKNEVAEHFSKLTEIYGQTLSSVGSMWMHVLFNVHLEDCGLCAKRKNQGLEHAAGAYHKTLAATVKGGLTADSCNITTTAGILNASEVDTTNIAVLIGVLADTTWQRVKKTVQYESHSILHKNTVSSEKQDVRNGSSILAEVKSDLQSPQVTQLVDCLRDERTVMEMLQKKLSKHSANMRNSVSETLREHLSDELDKFEKNWIDEVSRRIEQINLIRSMHWRPGDDNLGMSDAGNRNVVYSDKSKTSVKAVMHAAITLTPAFVEGAIKKALLKLVDVSTKLLVPVLASCAHEANACASNAAGIVGQNFDTPATRETPKKRKRIESSTAEGNKRQSFANKLTNLWKFYEMYRRLPNTNESGYEISADVHLGRFISTMRHKKKELSKEQQQQLEEVPGWKWRVNRRRMPTDDEHLSTQHNDYQQEQEEREQFDSETENEDGTDDAVSDKCDACNAFAKAFLEDVRDDLEYETRAQTGRHVMRSVVAKQSLRRVREEVERQLRGSEGLVEQANRCGSFDEAKRQLIDHAPYIAKKAREALESAIFVSNSIPQGCIKKFVLPSTLKPNRACTVPRLVKSINEVMRHYQVRSSKRNTSDHTESLSKMKAELNSLDIQHSSLSTLDCDGEVDTNKAELLGRKHFPVDIEDDARVLQSRLENNE